VIRRWGDRDWHDRILRSQLPGATDEERAAFSRVFRFSMSRGEAAQYWRMTLDIDARSVLASIRVPTLVIQREEVAGMDVRNSRYLAERIPGARLVELPGRDFAPSLGDQDRIFSELEGFIGGVIEGSTWDVEPERVVATVLFTDIVDATAQAAALGDHAWRELVQRHHEIVREQLARFRGKEVDTAGDGFVASFDGPARAIRCGCAISEAMPELGLDVRVGLHTGECS